VFRELGELLVGRDSTALAELIKNSYDADASKVVIHADHLDRPDLALIRVIDDGVGMTADQFESGFLRLASRVRSTGNRRSRLWKRRFVGEKGIGRLAAHKIARVLEVESVPKATRGRKPPEAISARIDWDLVESVETLDEVDAVGGVVVESVPRLNRSSGTELRLSQLRRSWTTATRNRFLLEVQGLQLPRILVEELPARLVQAPLLFDQPVTASSGSSDPGFAIELSGDFSVGESYWEAMLDQTDWVLEVDASKPAKRGSRTADFAIARVGDSSPSEVTHETVTVKSPSLPQFQARILVREGRPTGLLDRNRAWARGSSGVRVYQEGFRILPYGDPSDDWLEINRDYARRVKQLPVFEQYSDLDSGAGHRLLPNDQYVGAVFLTHDRAPTLQTLVNREGFVETDDFEEMRELLRLGVALTARARASADTKTRPTRRRRTRADGPIDWQEALHSARDDAAEFVKKAKSHIADGDYRKAARQYSRAVARYEVVAEVADDALDEASFTRVLASVGTQMSTFVHEMNNLLSLASALEALVDGLVIEGASAAERAELSRLRASQADLRQAVERHASYLTDVVSADARRRRSRPLIAGAIDSATNLVAWSAEAASIKIKNDVPADLRLPTPMFPAEINAVFANLLTNAVKAAGHGGRVRATTRQSADGSVRVRISNTGAAVTLADSEQWFEPFASTSESPDPVLGLGMGLGLPITRRMLEEYGATARFVKPARGYATTIEVWIPAA
jgi:signal transduction histidine kinase